MLMLLCSCIVSLLFRENTAKIGSIEHAEWQSKMNDVNGLADIILGKQRHGPQALIEFEGIYTNLKI